MGEPTQASFEALFRQHHKALCNLAYNIVRDENAAKDIVQDVFFKLWKNREGVEFGTQIKNYLFRATSHTSLNYLRFNKKITRLDDAPFLHNSLTNGSASESADYQELEARVRTAIDRLPARCRVIYMLSRHEGLKYQEIADSLGLSLKTVENQMGIALQKLREDLKPFLTPEFIFLIILGGLVLSLLFS